MIVNQAAAALLIGLTLLMGALADEGGRLRNPGGGGSVYMAAVVIVAVGVVYFDRKKRSTANSALSAVLAGTYRAGNDPPRQRPTLRSGHSSG